MVNPIAIKGDVAYACNKCSLQYNNEWDAAQCCKFKDWSDVTEFELKQVHLDLLKQSSIDWEDAEYGAPCIDPKRPYGNSNVEDDIAEIIKLKKAGNWDRTEEAWNDNAEELMRDLHLQTQIALEIILHCQTFRLGKYRKKEKYGGEWEFVGGQVNG